MSFFCHYNINVCPLIKYIPNWIYRCLSVLPVTLFTFTIDINSNVYSCGLHRVLLCLCHVSQNSILRIAFLKTQDQIIVFLILNWNVAHLKAPNVLIDMLQYLILNVKQLLLKHTLYVFLSLFSVQTVCARCQCKVLQQRANIWGIRSQILQKLDDHLHEVQSLLEDFRSCLNKLFLVLRVLESFLIQQRLITLLSCQVTTQALELVECLFRKLLILNV